MSTCNFYFIVYAQNTTQWILIQWIWIKIQQCYHIIYNQLLFSVILMYYTSENCCKTILSYIFNMVYILYFLPTQFWFYLFCSVVSFLLRGLYIIRFRYFYSLRLASIIGKSHLYDILWRDDSKFKLNNLCNIIFNIIIIMYFMSFDTNFTLYLNYYHRIKSQ